MRIRELEETQRKRAAGDADPPKRPCPEPELHTFTPMIVTLCAPVVAMLAPPFGEIRLRLSRESTRESVNPRRCWGMIETMTAARLANLEKNVCEDVFPTRAEVLTQLQLTPACEGAIRSLGDMSAEQHWGLASTVTENPPVIAMFVCKAEEGMTISKDAVGAVNVRCRTKLPS